MDNDAVPDVYAKICPSRKILAMIGEKWTSLVIGALAGGNVMRFGALKRRCEGISQKMLTQTLRNLERDGLVKRTEYPDESPLRVDYELTELGDSLVPIIVAAKEWAEDNLKTIEKNRLSK